MRKTTTILDSHWEVAERLAPNLDMLFPEGGNRNWIPATVPGHVHLDLLRAGMIADPFFRMQERTCQWVDLADWTYRATFPVDADRLSSAGEGGRHYLDFNGLDTIARVSLNGVEIGASENFFVPLRIDVTGALREGDNRLEVEFDSALRVGRERAAAYLGDGRSERGSQSYFNFSPRAFVRKAQYMFGWDWGPELVSCGIWQPVELVTVPVAEIVDWRYDYTFTDKGRVEIDIKIRVRKYDDRPINVGASLFAAGDTTPAARIEGGPGEYEVDLPIRGFRCVRWSPNGSGGQTRRYLLNLKVTAPPQDEDDEPEVYDFHGASVGFRTVELVRERDADGLGEGFKFRINGVDTFMKGANWIPDGSFPAAISDRRLRERLTQARDAGMNMIRVWGGGLYESDSFYSLCDELGILVWQDFAFACSMYPDDLPEFRESVCAEAVANVRRLRHHPSLALWCGGNENLELAEDRWAGATQATHFFGDRTIHETLPDVLASEDPHTPYWPNSPYGGARANSEEAGDSHYWNVWHAKTPDSNGDWVNYAHTRSRFLSEFGFAGPAGAAAWDAATAPEDRAVDSAVSRWHDKTRKGFANYLAYIEMHYPAPRTWDDLLYYGQLNQADALRFGVEHCRRNLGHCWGTLFWQLNDCWPTHSWAVIDSAGEPKAAYHAAKRFYAPLLLSLTRNGNIASACLVNDTITEVAGQLVLTGHRLDGTEVARVEQSLTGPPIAATPSSLTLALAAPGDDVQAMVYVEGRFVGPDGTLLAQAIILAREPRDTPFVDPKITWTAQTDETGTAILTLKAEKFAGSARLSFDGTPTPPRFSDNYFHLPPGQAREITVSDLPAEWDARAVEGRLRVRTLADTGSPEGGVK